MLAGDLPPTTSQAELAGLGRLGTPPQGSSSRITGFTSKRVLTLVNSPIGGSIKTVPDMS